MTDSKPPTYCSYPDIVSKIDLRKFRFETACPTIVKDSVVRNTDVGTWGKCASLGGIVNKTSVQDTASGQSDPVRATTCCTVKFQGQSHNYVMSNAHCIAANTTCPIPFTSDSSSNLKFPGPNTTSQPAVAQPLVCDGLGTASSGCYKNGEYLEVGRSGQCDWRPGSSAPLCKMTRYLANENDCALKNFPTLCDGNTIYTCDPDVLKGELIPGRRYKSVMNLYCNKNILANPTCISYCANNPEECRELITDTCRGANLETEACQTFCFDRTNSVPGLDCYTQLKEYCAIPENQKKDLCACHLPDQLYADYYRSLLVGFQDGPQKERAYSTLNVNPMCTYPPCAGRPRYYQKGDNCGVSSYNCIIGQYSKYDGVISGNVFANVNQTCNIGLVQKSCTKDIDCGNGIKCTAGKCDIVIPEIGAPYIGPTGFTGSVCPTGQTCIACPAGSTCPTGPSCPAGQTCSSGPTGNVEESVFEKNKTAIIIGIVFGILILLAILGTGLYFALRGKFPVRKKM